MRVCLKINPKKHAGKEIHSLTVPDGSRVEAVRRYDIAKAPDEIYLGIGVFRDYTSTTRNRVGPDKRPSDVSLDRVQVLAYGLHFWV